MYSKSGCQDIKIRDRFEYSVNFIFDNHFLAKLGNSDRINNATWIFYAQLSFLCVLQ